MGINVMFKLIFRIMLIHLLFLPATAHANIFEDAWGVITDPLKINSGTENMIHAIERAAIHAERLQGNIDGNIRAHLKQIDTIVRETRQSASQNIESIGIITNKAFNNISTIEKAFFYDARYFVKCSSEVSLFQLQTNLAKILNNLGKRKPRVKLFGRTIISAQIEATDIDSPISAFREIKTVYHQRLDAVGENDHPSKITDIYGDMQRLADLARCHYKEDNALYQELYWYEIEHNRLGKSWAGLVKPL